MIDRVYAGGLAIHDGRHEELWRPLGNPTVFPVSNVI